MELFLGLQFWHLVWLALAGKIEEENSKVVQYLQAENQVLREQVDALLARQGKKRILLTDDQRRRLAVAGKSAGRKVLGEIPTIFTPETILGWHRKLVAQKWTQPSKPVGRPKLASAVVELVVRLAKENSTWGCDRIAGEMKKLGHSLCDTSIENILKEHGIEPAPKRKSKTSWNEFLQSHWECLSAIDFTTVEVWTPTGLKTIYLLFVMELKTRQVQFLGSSANPNEPWMLDAIEQATCETGILGGDDHPTILLLDRDSKFTAKFKDKLKAAGVKPHVLPPRSPNLNSYIERFMLSYKSELAYRMIFFGKRMLDHATEQFLEHYHESRPHQGLKNELIVPFEKPPDPDAKIEVSKRLGGLLKSYHRAAA